MWTRRLAPPGTLSDAQAASKKRRAIEATDAGALGEHGAWDRFIHRPSPKRLGVACSGGGIRSAAYNLGVLQVLRRVGVLDKAEYLSCVSGGGYIAIAHALLVSSTLSAEAGAEPGATVPAKEAGPFFRSLPPWSPGSPEERHLRDHLSYLAPGLMGKIWALMNVLGGIFVHLLPLAAAIYLAGAVYGIALHRWLSPLRDPSNASPDIARFVRAPLLLAIALISVAGALLLVRYLEQTRPRPDQLRLQTFQDWPLTSVGFAAGVVALLVGFPALFLGLHASDFADTLEGFKGPWATLRAVLVYLTPLFIGLVAALLGALLLRRGRLQSLVPMLTLLATLLFIVGPFAGIAYWWAQSLDDTFWPRLIGFALSFVVLLFFLRVGQLAPNSHLYYRERLATAFVGRRSGRPGLGKDLVEFKQLEWKDTVELSKLVTTKGARAGFPRLVVCATANLSGDVPPGRMGSVFTFESDYCGGPLTGYISTTELECLAGKGVLTLPAMMAIAGAAVSPSMGKMTRSWLRFLMAIFNLRLGVWVPNPFKQDDCLQAWEVGRLRGSGDPGYVPKHAAPPTAGGRQVHRPRKPVAIYTLREALGLNSLSQPYIYVTDGGHYENLGLVELLRRGCCQILCFDAAGDDVEHFNTLSEAILLARSELGVDIRIDCDPLHANVGKRARRRGDPPRSQQDHVCGVITYPNGQEGLLIFAKATVTEDASQELRTFQERDRKFPNHPTSNQFFNDEGFEAYRSLGWKAATGAVKSLNQVRKALGMPPVRNKN